MSTGLPGVQHPGQEQDSPMFSAEGILRQCGALLEGHFVLTSGRHSGRYINKDAAWTDTEAGFRFGDMIAVNTWQLPIQVVVGPAMGAIILAQWAAHQLTRRVGRKVLAVYAEKEGEGFAIKRSYQNLIPGRQILVVEDVLTTGGSARKTVDAVKRLGGEVVAVHAIANRGGVTTEQLGVPKLLSLWNVDIQTWPEEDCTLCRDGVPVDTKVGKGTGFLARKAAQA